MKDAAACVVEALEGRRMLTTLEIDGTGGNDVIALDVTDNGSTFVWTTDNYASNHSQSVSGVTQIFIFAGGGNDSVRIERNNSVPTLVDGQGGANTLTIKALSGRQDLSDAYLGGVIDFQSGASSPFSGGSVFINDTDHVGARTHSFDVQTLTGGSIKPFYSNGSLRVNFNAGTDSATLNTGRYNDLVLLQRTQVTPVTVNSAGGTDAVVIGNNVQGTQGIQANVTVLNTPAHTDLSLDDSADAAARDAYLDSAVLNGTTYNVMSGLSPAPISWKLADVNLVNITTGQGSDSVTVRGLDAFTNVTNGGTSADHFHVGITANFFNLRNIVQFYGGSGTFDLDLNDSAETSGVNYSIGYGQLAGAFPGGVHWDVPKATNVTLTCGPGNDNVDVYENRQPTRINGGAGNDTFSFDGASHVIDGVYDVTLSGGGGANRLFLDDESQPALAGTSSVAYQQTQTTLNKGRYQFGNLQSYYFTATYDGSIQTTYWRTGKGNDSMLLQGTPAGTIADVNNGGGNDTHLIGGVPGVGMGNLLGVAAVFHDGSAGSTKLLIDDDGDATGDNVSIDSDSIATLVYGMAPSEVDYQNADVDAVTITGGQGADLFNVLHLYTPTKFELGGGNDVLTVNNFDNLAAASVAGNVSVEGGGGSDRLFVDNASSTATDANGCGYGVGNNINQQTIDASNNYHLVRQIDHSGFETLQLTAGAGADTIFANCTQPNVQTMIIDGGGGTDHIEAEANPAGGLTYIHSSDALDSVLAETNAMPGVAAFDRNTRLASLTITNGAAAGVVDLPQLLTLTVGTLSITGTGRLDLHDNALVVDGPGSTPYPTIAGYVTSGYAGGALDGPGIDSSTAAATPGRVVGVAPATALFSSFPAIFAGQSVSASSVLLRTTATGDSNLDGTTGFPDLLTLAQNYGLSGRTFAQGDQNYDGLVNFADLLALSQQYGQSLIRMLGDTPLDGSRPRVRGSAKRPVEEVVV